MPITIFWSTPQWAPYYGVGLGHSWIQDQAYWTETNRSDNTLSQKNLPVSTEDSALFLKIHLGIDYNLTDKTMLGLKLTHFSQTTLTFNDTISFLNNNPDFILNESFAFSRTTLMLNLKRLFLTFNPQSVR